MFSLQKITVLLVFLFISRSAAGIWLSRPAAGAGEAGMAYACIMKPGIWSAFHNQAALPLSHGSAFSFSYENRFGLKELAARSVCLVIPSGNSAIGAVCSYSGYSGFSRETIGLAGGTMLGSGFSAGVQANIHIENQAGDYKDYIMVTCEGGFLIDLSDNVRAGLHVFNPVPNSLRKVPVHSAIRAGAGIELPGNLFTAIEAEMKSGKRINLRTGFEYTPCTKIRLRGGYSAEEPSFSFGFGYALKPALVDIAFSTHPALGITSSFSVSFILRKSDNKK